ncbi:chaperone modulator CbpM [Agriterribacter sp.]|uniref:chaperone modulator CbpM n=1 Tax=Agriterribacter sp. TaxID=2821509 RepID=UPI002C33992E|nr:chaperone modulator CbpM [Agriterribacter sp.]HRO46144.1 chaperone modulator CbpM [Agriterribacter sp.]HRQ16258.1 chaperone modulator CbpM [Agriterribacter sp.]
MPNTEELITPEACCAHYHIELTFIQSLSEYGLIEIISVEEKQFIHNEQLRGLEKFIRLHYELGINMEGIDAIAHLLRKMENMQEEITLLKNKLQL